MFQIFNEIFGSVLSVFGAIMAVISLVLGLITLLYGHKTFWIFAVLIGLAFSLVLVPQLMMDQSKVVQTLLIIAIMAVCGILAVYAQKTMVILSGFIGLGMFGYFFANLLNLQPNIGWALFIGNGIFGAWLMSKYLDWAVVVVSSVLGAFMAVAGLAGLIKFNLFINLLIFLGFFIAG